MPSRTRIRRRRRDGVHYQTRPEGVPVGDLNDHVETEVVPEPEPVVEVDEGVTANSRLHQVRHRASQYEREFRLRLLHRMLMRGIPLDEIARELDISVSTVMRDRKELWDRLRTAAKKLDINLLIGDTMAFYNEAVAMAMRHASNSKHPINMRLASIRTAVNAKNDQTRMMAQAGVFEALKFTPDKTKGQGDIQKLMRLTREILDEDKEAGIPTASGGIPESELFNLPGIEDEDVAVV